MDIITHAMIGAIVATPLIESNPIAAASLMLGATLPDMDVLGRCLGKRAFLRAHQTYTHSFFFIALVAALCWFAWKYVEMESVGWEMSIGLGIGMLSHSLLDLTNTYGITILTPFSARRYALEWMFFIDAVVIAVTLLVLCLLYWVYQRQGNFGYSLALGYILFFMGYLILKRQLRRRASRYCPPHTVSLLPDGVCPWIFLGFARNQNQGKLFRIHALTGKMYDVSHCLLLDESYRSILETLPEYRIMQALSPAYHLVAISRNSGKTVLVCKDLRTRNFHTSFGMLEVVLYPDNTIERINWHV